MIDNPAYLQWLDGQSSYHNSPAYIDAEKFWRSRFGDPISPVFRARRYADEASAVHSAVWTLPQSLWDRFERTAVSNDCTSTDFLLTAIAIWVSRTQFIEDGMVVGLACANRHTTLQRQTVGVFASILPLRVRVDEAAGFIVNMKHVAAERRRAFQHARFPIGELAAEAGWTGPHLDIVLSMESMQDDLSRDGMEAVSFHTSKADAPLSLAFGSRGEDHNDSHMSLVFADLIRAGALPAEDCVPRWNHAHRAGATGSDGAACHWCHPRGCT